MLVMGIFFADSSTVKARHIYGLRIDYEYLYSRTNNGITENRYRLTIICNHSDPMSSGDPQIIIQSLNSNHQITPNFFGNPNTQNINQNCPPFMRTAFGVNENFVEVWLRQGEWYRVNLVEDYVINGNLCDNTNGNFDRFCCPVDLANKATGLWSNVRNGVQYCPENTINLRSWHASNTITEFFSHPTNPRSPNFETGNNRFVNAIFAEVNQLNTYNFSIVPGVSGGNVSMHLARPITLNQIFLSINPPIPISTNNTDLANLPPNENIMGYPEARTFQFAPPFTWQNPFPLDIPITTNGTLLEFKPSQTTPNAGYYTAFLFVQLNANGQVISKQLLNCVVYVRPFIRQITNFTCNDRNLTICFEYVNRQDVILISYDGVNWINQTVNSEGCIRIPYNAQIHQNGFTLYIQNPYTCRVITQYIPPANLQCCENLHYGETCTRNISTYNNLHLLNHNSNAPRREVSMQGHLVINTNLTINNCNVRMFPGTRLEIAPGVKLTITNSRLYACDTLWHGITNTNVTNANAEIYIENSTIEDAFVAVNMVYSTLTVRNSTFRNNYYHLSAAFCTVNPIENNTFTTVMNANGTSGRILPEYRGGLCAALPAMVAPNGNRVTQDAITLEEPNFQSGAPLCTLNANRVQRAYRGLVLEGGQYVLNSSGLNADRNIFSYLYEYGIYGIEDPTFGPVAYIRAINNRFTNIVNTLPTTYPNILIFSEAIRLSGFRLFADGNQFTNIYAFSIHLDKGDYSFYTPLPGFRKDYEIVNNTFSYGGIGADIYAYDNPGATIEIQNNRFLGYVNNHFFTVFIANTLPSKFITDVIISSNIVRNKGRGFYLANVFPRLIDNNLIYLADVGSHILTKFGIRLENISSFSTNGNSSEVKNNTVKMSPLQIPTTEHVGIDLASAVNIHLANNLVDGLGQGIMFSDDNRLCKIECNQVKDYQNGWSLLNSNGLGTQGTGATPQDNQWVRTPNSYFNQNVWDILVQGNILPIDLYIRQGAGSGSIYYPIDISDPNLVNLLISQGSENTYCNYPPGSSITELISQDRLLPANTLQEIAIKKESMQNTYRFLQFASSLTPDEIAYRDSLGTTSIGKFASIADSLYAQNIVYTTQELNQLNCSCPVDDKLKQVMQVYNATFAVGIDTFTAGQLDTLMTIAYSPKSMSHKAVLAARLMLLKGYDFMIEFSDFAPQSQKTNRIIVSEENNDFPSAIYPNPASENVWIESPIGSEVVITDLMGKEYFHLKTQEDNASININRLQSGVYFVKIAYEGKEKYHKLVISR